MHHHTEDRPARPSDDIVYHLSSHRSTYDYDGCFGGFTLTAFNYVASVGGITTEALYPYDTTTSFCDKSKNDYAVTVTMAYRVEGEANMINQVLAGKTLSVAVDANQWGSYQSGIFSGCSAIHNVNHAVNIVGVNLDEGYWIIRNSWGSWWGDNGYMKLALVRENAFEQYSGNVWMPCHMLDMLVHDYLCACLAVCVQYRMPYPASNLLLHASMIVHSSLILGIQHVRCQRLRHVHGRCSSRVQVHTSNTKTYLTTYSCHTTYTSP